jgi:hypothetical protein
MAGPHAIDVLLSILPLLAYCWSFFFFFLSFPDKRQVEESKERQKNRFCFFPYLFFLFFIPRNWGFSDKVGVKMT